MRSARRHGRPAAAETERFQSATAPPSPLRQRLAQERGQPIAIQATVELTGELYRPAGDGPFPAVVQLHGCGGEEVLYDRRFSTVVANCPYCSLDSGTVSAPILIGALDDRTPAEACQQ